MARERKSDVSFTYDYVLKVTMTKVKTKRERENKREHRERERAKKGTVHLENNSVPSEQMMRCSMDKTRRRTAPHAFCLSLSLSPLCPTTTNDVGKPAACSERKREMAMANTLPRVCIYLIYIRFSYYYYHCVCVCVCTYLRTRQCSSSVR